MEDRIVVFLICGKARSGKNTFAKYLETYLNMEGAKVCRIEIMRTLKGYIKDYFGWSGNDEDKPRELLQKFGTEIIREKMNMPMFHLDRLTEDIKILSNYFNTFIVDDVRFPLEIEEIRKRFENVIAINIVRDNYDNQMTEEQAKHITEIALDNYDNYDRIIENTTLEELEENAKLIVREVMKNEIHD